MTDYKGNFSQIAFVFLVVRSARKMLDITAAICYNYNRSAAHNKKRYINGRGRTPITKNANSVKQNVRVFGADGTQIGSTYPKRAAGLVKKGRAHYVSDFDIRLNASDVTDITEDTKMDNNIITKEEKQSYNVLYFNAREWSFNKACEDNVGSRSFMNGPDGELAEAFTIGNWDWDWTEIRTKQLVLTKNTPYLFTFWLNGGENDRRDEVCRFEVIFNSDYESRYTYNLNRSFIRPVKRLNGWELYEIPFITGDNEYTELRFVAQRAYMTVMAAKDKAAYDELSDTVDEFEDIRPQRHNIVFSDGWPCNTWYSTKSLRAKKEAEQNKADGGSAKIPAGNPDELSEMLDAVNGTLNGVPAMVSGVLGGVVNSCGFLRQKVLEAVASSGVENTDEISEMIMDSLDDKLSGLVDSISDNIDAMVDNIGALLENVEEKLDEAKSAAEDM